MHKMKILAVLAAAAALGACTSAPQGQMRALLDETGTVVSYLPESEVRDTPPGTAFRLNLNGRDQTVTLGPRVSEGISAGTAYVARLDNGRPRIEHTGPGVGDLAPAGAPYVARLDNGRPIIGFRSGPDASGQSSLETTP